MSNLLIQSETIKLNKPSNPRAFLQDNKKIAIIRVALSISFHTVIYPQRPRQSASLVSDVRFSGIK